MICIGHEVMRNYISVEKIALRLFPKPIANSQSVELNHRQNDRDPWVRFPDRGESLERPLRTYIRKILGDQESPSVS